MSAHRLVVTAALALLAACATATYSPELARLDDSLERVESDERIALNADRELDRARAMLDALRTEGRRLDDVAYAHRIYLAERRIATAAALGLARHAEARVERLSTEREMLLIDARTREARTRRVETRSRLAQEQHDDGFEDAEGED